ncbi:MAG: sigma-70 family RNA polymerase sigma factor [Mariprofundaceae bacterium]
MQTHPLPGGQAMRMMRRMARNSRPEQWLEEHGDYLYRFAFARLRDEEAAAEMVQETLLAAWRGRAGFKGEASVRTWLTGILKYKIIDHIRRQIRDRDLADELENDPTSAFFDASGHWADHPRPWRDDPARLCEDAHFRETLDRCLEGLPEKQRLAFGMREIGGDDTPTICKALDITPTHLHVLIHRARLALRKCLEIHWFGRNET